MRFGVRKRASCPEIRERLTYHSEERNSPSLIDLERLADCPRHDPIRGAGMYRAARFAAVLRRRSSTHTRPGRAGADAPDPTPQTVRLEPFSSPEADSSCCLLGPSCESAAVQAPLLRLDLVRVGGCTGSERPSTETSSDDQGRVHRPAITSRTHRPYGHVRLASLLRTMGKTRSD